MLSANNAYTGMTEVLKDRSISGDQGAATGATVGAGRWAAPASSVET